jgi:hypothetical protein
LKKKPVPKTKKIIYLFHHNINIYLHVKSKYPRQRRILLHLRVPIEKKKLYNTSTAPFYAHFDPAVDWNLQKRGRAAPLCVKKLKRVGAAVARNLSGGYGSRDYLIPPRLSSSLFRLS